MKIKWIIFFALVAFFTTPKFQAQHKDTEEFDYVRHEFPHSKGFAPKNGLVPDAKTAEAIAYAVALPIYGEQKIRSELPFRSELKLGSWVILGTLHCDGCFGGTLIVQIDQRTGKILFISHSK